MKVLRVAIIVAILAFANAKRLNKGAAKKLKKVQKAAALLEDRADDKAENNMVAAGRTDAGRVQHLSRTSAIPRRALAAVVGLAAASGLAAGQPTAVATNYSNPLDGMTGYEFANANPSPSQDDMHIAKQVQKRAQSVERMRGGAAATLLESDGALQDKVENNMVHKLSKSHEADVEVANAELVEAEIALVEILALKQRQEAKRQTLDYELAAVNDKLLAAEEVVKEAKETREVKVRAMQDAETQKLEEAVLDKIKLVIAVLDDKTWDTLAALWADVQKAKAYKVRAEEALAAAKLADQKARTNKMASLSDSETSEDPLAGERHAGNCHDAEVYASWRQQAEVVAEEARQKWNEKVQSYTKAASAKLQPQNFD